jgi:hypothetical protein
MPAGLVISTILTGCRLKKAARHRATKCHVTAAYLLFRQFFVPDLAWDNCLLRPNRGCSQYHTFFASDPSDPILLFFIGRPLSIY